MANSAGSSHPALSRADDIAASWTDFLLLVGRVFLGWLFLASGYGKLGVILGAALILGIGTRYAALASFVWVLVATAIAHRYWTYPAPAQAAQYNNFLKNIAIMGGALCAFVTGAGRYAVDAVLAKR
jgi:putative oxidoreductase